MRRHHGMNWSAQTTIEYAHIMSANVCSRHIAHISLCAAHFNPIVAVLLASLFLGETVTPVLIAGLVFVIGGIFVANRRAAAAGAGGPQTPKA